MVKRGEIWTVSGGPDFAGKPRPAVIVQDKFPEGIDSLTLCLFTSETDVVSPYRVPVESDKTNGLRCDSHIMVEKISTVNRRKLGQRIGVLAPEDVIKLERGLRWYLGLAPSPDTSAPPE